MTDRANKGEVMTPTSMRKLAAALEHSADYDKPEDKRRVMFSVARSLFGAAKNIAHPDLAVCSQTCGGAS